MLILSRKPGQSIFIGDTEVVVQRLSKGRVSLGVRAPKDVEVLRKELKDKGEQR